VAAIKQGYVISKSNTPSIITTDVTDESKGSIPGSFALAQNYPNPFNPETVIEYSLPTSSFVTLSIYNTLGQEVAKLIDGRKSAGTYTTVWNGENSNGSPAASGVFLYIISAGEFSDTRKMLLLR
jgi:hypothetical protein